MPAQSIRRSDPAQSNTISDQILSGLLSDSIRCSRHKVTNEANTNGKRVVSGSVRSDSSPAATLVDSAVLANAKVVLDIGHAADVHVVILIAFPDRATRRLRGARARWTSAVVDVHSRHWSLKNLHRIGWPSSPFVSAHNRWCFWRITFFERFIKIVFLFFFYLRYFIDLRQWIEAIIAKQLTIKIESIFFSAFIFQWLRLFCCS